jgi:hypothetical protein
MSIIMVKLDTEKQKKINASTQKKVWQDCLLV